MERNHSARCCVERTGCFMARRPGEEISIKALSLPQPPAAPSKVWPLLMEQTVHNRSLVWPRAWTVCCMALHLPAEILTLAQFFPSRLTVFSPTCSLSTAPMARGLCHLCWWELMETFTEQLRWGALSISGRYFF